MVLVYIEFDYEFWAVFQGFQFELNQVDKYSGKGEEQKLRYIYIKVEMLINLVDFYSQYCYQVGYWAFSEYVYFDLEFCKEKILLCIFVQEYFFKVVVFLVGQNEVVNVEENE